MISLPHRLARLLTLFRDIRDINSAMLGDCAIRFTVISFSVLGSRTNLPDFFLLYFHFSVIILSLNLLNEMNVQKKKMSNLSQMWQICISHDDQKQS